MRSLRRPTRTSLNYFVEQPKLKAEDDTLQQQCKELEARTRVYRARQKPAQALQEVHAASSRRAKQGRLQASDQEMLQISA